MKILAFITLITLSLSCSAGNSNKRTKSKNNEVSNLETNSEDQNANDPFKLVATKVKNCDRFLSTLSKLTGVKLSDTKYRALRNRINSIKSGCPSSMQLAKISSNNILFFPKGFTRTLLSICRSYLRREGLSERLRLY